MTARRRRFLPKKVPTQARALATYASLLDAAARLLGQHGFAQLTTNRIAEVAGVAIGSLYEYFPDKETIVAEVVRRLLRETLAELGTSLEASLPALATEGLEGALRRLVHALVEIVDKRRALVLAATRDVPFVRDLDEMQAFSESILELARKARPFGASALFEHDAEAVSFVVSRMVMSTIVDAVTAPPPGLRREAIVEALLRVLVRVLT